MQNKNLINESEISEALEAVSRDGTNINEPRFMHLQGNKRVVLAAVKSTGEALEYASEVLKKDREIVLAAMKEDLIACRYSLLGHEETKALLKEISLEKYVSLGELKGISVFDRIRKEKDSVIKINQNQQTLSKIISYFSLRDASTFSELTKETNELMKPDLGKVSKRLIFIN